MAQARWVVRLIACIGGMTLTVPASAFEVALSAAAQRGSGYAAFEAYATIAVSLAEWVSPSRAATVLSRRVKAARQTAASSERLGHARTIASESQPSESQPSESQTTEHQPPKPQTSGDVPNSPQGRTRTGTAGAGATKPKPARLRIDDAFLRGLMRACGREYRLASRELTELSARARTSAWLPALRVRGGRNTDETLRLTPTDADPDRFQLVGGDDYRFEGQLSWDFRRLVFANEELAVERLRRGLDAERWKRQQQAMKALQRWLAAWVQIDDETRLPEERAASWVSERGARAELDWLSHGWFSRWAPRATSRMP